MEASVRVFSNPGGAYRRGKRARIVSLCPIIVGSWMFSELSRRDANASNARDAGRSTHSWGGGSGDDDLITARDRLDDASKPTGGHGEA